MQRLVALILLCLQLAFAGLPGDGFVLCIGGDHGHEHGAPVHDAGSSDDCDGLHLTRGAADQRPTDGSPTAAMPARAVALVDWPAWLPHGGVGGGGNPVAVAVWPRARGAPAAVPRPDPATQAARAVRTIELRI